MLDLTGRTLGNYQIREELGRGGMAVVYRAFQPSLNRYVAIKVLPPQLAFDRQFIERFLREARAAAGLRQPNIVVVHDVGEEGGVYYIVMEYLEGQTLKQLVEREGPLPPERAGHILEQVAAALDYAHRRGFVHRDVKPANIFVGENDRVTLTDFGIAKAASEVEQLTRTGMLVGTPEYMAPEQAEGSTVDHRTDLYALGVVLYQMLTGRVPFKATTPHATLYAVVHEQPPPPRQVKPDLSPAVESVVLRAVAKHPAQRFQSGAEMAKALRASLSGRPQPAVTVPPPAARPVPRPRERVPRPQRRRGSPLVWIMAGLAGVLVVLLGLLLVLALGSGRDGTPTPTHTQAVAWKTPTEASSDALPTAEPTATLAAPADTEAAPTQPPPAASNTPPPTHTSISPTDTAPPPPASATPVPTAPPPTNTPKPSPTPPPTPCPVQAQGLFAGLWQTYKNRLGCPLYANPQAIQDAEQAFDNGHMFWRADNDRAYVVYESGPNDGTYQTYSNMWSAGDPDYSCPASPPPGKVQPKRGFGAVWCSLGGAGAAIGWGLGEEAGFGPGYGDPLVQDFERGVILRDSDGGASGRAYVFFGNGTFVRKNY